MSTTWPQKLDAATLKTGSSVCVGLDPDPRRMPVPDVFEFNRAIIDATLDLACAFKPQIAFYEALGIDGLNALKRTVEHIRRVAPHAVVVGDVKRGDIDSTAEAYARAMFDLWDFDVVTVHAYLGRQSIEPFLGQPGRGVLIVCRTSNPGVVSCRTCASRPPAVGPTSPGNGSSSTWPTLPKSGTGEETLAWS